MLAHSLFMSGHVGKCTHNTTLLHDTQIVHLCKINICSLPKSTLSLYPCYKNHISFFVNRLAKCQLCIFEMFPGIYSFSELYFTCSQLLKAMSDKTRLLILEESFCRYTKQRPRAAFLKPGPELVIKPLQKADILFIWIRCAGARRHLVRDPGPQVVRTSDPGSGNTTLVYNMYSVQYSYCPLDDTIVTTKYSQRGALDSLFFDTIPAVSWMSSGPEI